MPDGLIRCAVTIAAALLAVPSAFGQEAINTDAALQPSKGALIIRQLFRYREATTDPTPMDRDVREFNFTTTFIYGISAELAAIFKVPVVYREADFPSPVGTDRGWGVRDLEALLKIRLYRDDFGPARTARFDLLAGMEFYSGDADFATRSVDPEIGGVFTYLRDRHAIDADLIWRLDTSGDVADRMRYDLAYVRRLYPAVYEAGKFDSVFGVLELNGIYETNGDNELFLSPGLQYKTKRMTLEATVQIPVWQDLDNRLESDLVVGAGIRLRF